MNINVFTRTLQGALDYFFKFDQKEGRWDGAFNGQEHRRKMFQDILKNFNIDIIIETGTFRGTTTEYMYDSSRKPVYSVESHPRYWFFSWLRFKNNKEVHIRLGDSREFLRDLTKNRLLENKNLFIYLDAHWNTDLPLGEEIEIIFNAWPSCIVMVDDFSVPDDAGYKYDDYGKGKTLSLEYLNTVTGLELKIFFPSLSSAKETGKKRGCVVLIKDTKISNILRNIDSFREWV